MEKFLKKVGWTSIITSIILLIIGIIMIYNPETTMQFISTILGIFFIMIGIIKLINYFIAKGNSVLYDNEIAFGVISIIVGLVVMVYSNTIENIFRTKYYIIAIALGVMGVLIYIGDKWAEKKYKGKVSAGEVGLPMTNSTLVLPCGIYGLWEDE